MDFFVPDTDTAYTSNSTLFVDIFSQEVEEGLATSTGIGLIEYVLLHSTSNAPHEYQMTEREADVWHSYILVFCLALFSLLVACGSAVQMTSLLTNYAVKQAQECNHQECNHQ